MFYVHIETYPQLHAVSLSHQWMLLLQQVARSWILHFEYLHEVREECYMTKSSHALFH